jgi:hypothetical protein
MAVQVTRKQAVLLQGTTRWEAREAREALRSVACIDRGQARVEEGSEKATFRFPRIWVGSGSKILARCEAGQGKAEEFARQQQTNQKQCVDRKTLQATGRQGDYGWDIWNIMNTQYLIPTPCDTTSLEGDDEMVEVDMKLKG